ncbi:MAG TPA: hypothetical protein VFA78_00435 [Chloroflexota bacterium]|nr:hypothetical protein [Chloroflexota bacterium]
MGELVLQSVATRVFDAKREVWNDAMTRGEMETATELAAHVATLCAQHDVRVEWIERSKRAWAIRKHRAVRIYPVINQKRYATALHEIGHIVGRRQSGRRIEQEWGAWEFALEASIVEFTPATYRMIHRALTSYILRYTHRKGAYLPPKGDPFWRFVEEIADRAAF